jgi:predicted ATPase/class 3 adenylate cyclase
MLPGMRSELPSGTVAFLFTDVEGSTRLLQALGPEGYARLLADHHGLLRQVWQRHRGYEVDTEGDAFFVAFAQASEALRAAAEAQKALQDREWPPGVELRVRIGIHSGEALLAGDHYVGLAVHRAARISAAAHGGQVLVSQATAELLADEQLDGLGLRDLGLHRLKDLSEPQRLYQLLAAGLRAELPPPRTLENRPTNLPMQPTPLVGRERELGELTELLSRPHVRLLTLTGPGGTGKTRLALQLAADSLESFPDGVWFVNLAALSDPELVLPTIAQTLAVAEQPGATIAQTLLERLREQELLLVLDNFEQVTEAAPRLAELLAAAGQLNLIVTSRASLHLTGEYEYAVPVLAGEEALALFAERAQAVKTSFLLNGNRGVVAEICRRLDHLPLAIELAAARIKLLPENALLQRLDERLKLLTGGGRDLDERQQTLRAAIDWSYNLLSADEQMLFRRLAVFAGGRTFEAIEAICGPDGDLDVFETVASLVDKSLLRQEEAAEGEPRFIMLETVHEYARERLGALAEAEAIHRNHARYFLELADVADSVALLTTLNRFEQEHANFRAALAWARQHDAELGAKLAVALYRFWDVRGHVKEGRAWLRDFVALAGISERSRGRALTALAALELSAGEIASALDATDGSIEILRRTEDTAWLARAVCHRGLTMLELGRLDEATEAFERAAAQHDQLGDLRNAAINRANLGLVGPSSKGSCACEGRLYFGDREFRAAKRS